MQVVCCEQHMPNAAKLTRQLRVWAVGRPVTHGCCFHANCSHSVQLPLPIQRSRHCSARQLWGHSTSQAAYSTWDHSEYNSQPGPPVSSQISSERDEHFMRMALEQAQIAASLGEVPVGAVVVAADGQTVLAAAHNLTHTRNDPTAHAELQAISKASQVLGNWRLLGATLYCTIEPCPMCAGAILQARLSRLVYGAPQPRLGADGSWIRMFPEPPLQSDSQQGPCSAASKPRSRERHAAGNPGMSSGPQAEAGSVLAVADVRQGQLRPCSDDPHGVATRCAMGVGHASPQEVDDSSVGSESCESTSQAGSEQTDVASQAGSEQTDVASHLKSARDNAQGQRQQAPVAAGWAAVALKHPFHDQITVTRGVIQQDCAALMRTFFRARRNSRGADTHGLSQTHSTSDDAVQPS